MLIASPQRSLPLFLVGFIALFVLSGLGNGSTYKMIPAIFRAKAAGRRGRRRRGDRAAARRLSGALIGIAGAIGALGGVLVNLAFRQSFLTPRHGDARLRRVHRLLRAVPGGDVGGVPAGPAWEARGRLTLV